MRRYTVTLGSPTTAGGRVTSASSDSAIDGMAVALEGDTVACPACGRAGRILCVGPRIPETWQGRHVALENDLCTCRCTPPPRLLASQTMRCQVLKDTGHAQSQALDPGTAAPRRTRGAAAGAGSVGSPTGAGYGGRFVLLDALTGAALAHREYAVVRQSGRLEFGISDAGGQTHLLASAPGAQGQEIYDIYI
jgi:uncharacterized Zn-binding protein involved in type VI secretion